MDQDTDHPHDHPHEHDPAETTPPVSPTEPAPRGTAPPAAPAPAPTSSTSSAPAPAEVPPHTHEPEGSRWAFWAKLAVLLFFVGYAVAFVVGNDKSIRVDFVFATGHVSLIWTILLLLLLGLAAGWLFGHLYRRHGRKQVRKP
jgi:uncharacterized integral membrane protein